MFQSYNIDNSIHKQVRMTVPLSAHQRIRASKSSPIMAKQKLFYISNNDNSNYNNQSNQCDCVDNNKNSSNNMNKESTNNKVN